MGDGLNPDLKIKSLFALIINEKLDRKSVKMYQKRIQNDYN
jgi:hypothetical protein